MDTITKLNHKENKAVAENVYSAMKKRNEVKHRIRTTKIKHGTKLTPLSTKQGLGLLIQKLQETSDMFWPAKLQCTNRPHVKSSLQFTSSVKFVTIWKIEFCESMWRIHHTIADLFLKYIHNHPGPWNYNKNRNNM